MAKSNNTQFVCCMRDSNKPENRWKRTVRVAFGITTSNLTIIHDTLLLKVKCVFDFNWFRYHKRKLFTHHEPKKSIDD